jgi:hypothetical protein
MMINPELQVSMSDGNGNAGLPCGVSDSRKSVFVLFTSTNETLRALEKARELAKPFGDPISVVALQTVPWILPIESAPVPFEFLMKHFQEVSGQFSAKIQLLAYLCRDRLAALKRILRPGSRIVIAVKPKWWPTRDARLADRLRHAGFRVVLVTTE